MSLTQRIKSLFDQSAWLFMLPACLVLSLFDADMAKAVVQWTLVAVVLAGVANIVARITFPQLDIERLVGLVCKDNRAAAIVLAALVLCVGLIFLSLVLWARG